MSANKKAGLRGAGSKGIARPDSTTGGYRWRKLRGLLTISDHVRRYQARRYPRAMLGRLPLPDDLLPCWREVRV